MGGAASDLTADHQPLDLGDRLRRVQTFRAGLGAVHDGVAAIELERVLERIETLGRRLVAAVDDPAVGMEQRRRAEVAVRVPPVARAGGRAAGAHHAFIKTVELAAVLDRLPPFLLGNVGLGLQERHDRGVLRVEMRQIRDQVLHHRHVRQRVDLDGVALDLIETIDAGERVDPVDVHRAGAADAFAARAAEGQRRVDLVLDLDQRVEDHRTAFVHVQEIAVDARVLPGVRIPAVDLELAHILRAFRLRPGLADADLRILRKLELNHGFHPLQSVLA
ncbi:hypothetical protein SDC9_19965 [bioreactor metagenome]|uniref:Uncharacterized protein n=1 Tax=bioreactor metagenome TaxID=1076179 RepID=A0A644U5F0_9ZZZZ